ncbi:autoinducer-binding protein [Pleomorphomonas carboxyditropha]|uniref:Autoinducer-binding protein n=1 Tax=Pleomorphomonas carboxyditropha TaxID=2023338 RepID=A0A2G9WSB6_9HYPH|nr:autoinducer-binding protein [Pleomorphomonas carboxyditropha]
MRTWFQRLVDTLAVTQTEETLRKAVADLVQDLGFGGFAFLHVEPARTIAVSNYPEEWQERYLDGNYPAIDPIVKIARSRMRPFNWVTGNPRSAENQEIRNFYEEANDFGIRSGISIPVRTAFQYVSMLTLASDKSMLRLESDIDQTAAVTAVGYLHAKIEQQDRGVVRSGVCELTPKQALCLKWSAEGKTMRDIAVLEDMSFATVNFHLNNARKALDAGSLAQATAIATRLRLI